MSTASYVLAGAVVFITVLTGYLSSKTHAPATRARSLGAKLAPGPKQNFLLGNIPGFPQEDWYRHFSKYQKEFGAWVYEYDLTFSLYIIGDVVFLNLNAAGVTMLVVGSLEIAEELAGKRTKVYSSRPYTVMLSEL